MEGVEEGKKGGSRKERKLLDFLYVLTRPKTGGYLGPYFSEKESVWSGVLESRHVAALLVSSIFSAMPLFSTAQVG